MMTSCFGLGTVIWERNVSKLGGWVGRKRCKAVRYDAAMVVN